MEKEELYSVYLKLKSGEDIWINNLEKQKADEIKEAFIATITNGYPAIFEGYQSGNTVSEGGRFFVVDYREVAAIEIISQRLM